MKYYIILLVAFFIISCRNITNTTTEKTVFTDTATFINDVPQGVYSYLFDAIIWERNYLKNLDTLEKGYPTLEIRIWYMYAEQKDRQIVVVKNDNGWKGELHTTTWELTPDSGHLVNRQFKSLAPKIGWDKFVDSLILLGIRQLPDKSKIPLYPHNAHVSTVHVEIADKNSYKFYSYSTPGYAGKRIPEAKRMSVILMFVEDQLGFKMVDNSLLAQGNIVFIKEPSPKIEIK